MKTPYLLGTLALLAFGGAQAFASSQTINNDTWWKDQNGNPIYAQGGGVNYFNGTYYMYGVQYAGAQTYYNGGGSNSNTAFVAINCYTSTDLAHWTFQKSVVTTGTSGFSGTSWVGRLGSVCYNSASGKYVLWVGYAGPNGTGVACLTSSSLTGSFALNNVQTSITNVYYNVPGDMTVFCDRNHGSTPYLVFSDPHGREHAYVSTFNSTQTAINAAVLISEWPQGQEGDCMYEFGGNYHLCMSQLAGWSYSHAYVVYGNAIQTPSSYTKDADFYGTDATNTYWSQISYFIDVHGSSVENIVEVGDRWADFSSTYKSAGHGNNFLTMNPITYANVNPVFNGEASWSIDAATGNWSL
ncbi:MAG TPA: hypothetical protein VGL42_15170 [Opitutaceae bacterium]